MDNIYRKILGQTNNKVTNSEIHLSTLPMKSQLAYPNFALPLPTLHNLPNHHFSAPLSGYWGWA